ncbi:ExbD/TolR family protein [Mucilaginibacter sp.]|uniref:ExbD/TolR family protein n=1 Tax=Mucilaginibacter sp. TaxID=1882438 RepID=UPI003B00B70D
MPRAQIKRKSTAIDMTAMCDMAFLLLTFFILTSKFKTEDLVPVDIPGSSVTIKLPDDVAIITVGQNKVFFGMEGEAIRRQTLESVGQKYNVTFTPEEKAVFETLPSFGVPIQSLKQFLDMSPDQRKELKQPGIPTDSVSNELFNWVREARVSAKLLVNKELRISIKGDSKEEYPVIKKVIDILQKQKVNKFSLITSLRAAN